MKDVIVKTAIRLFNQKGFAHVSMKQIADELKMSAGNLSYHFKTKEVLLANIYTQMRTEAVNYILPDTYLTLHHFEEIIQKFTQHQQQYAFFFQDVVNIVRAYPEIAAQYHETTQKRFVQARQLINYYIETERLKPADEAVNYDQLIHVVWMVTTFWASQAQIAQMPGYTVNQCQPIELLWNLIIPLMTKKGKEEYKQIRKFVKLNKS
ncbi:TetR/AcrR family transcriptional regulator [Microscilla marina]|uniref:Transcriptional regulator, TetR family protein n=1 Tax=Microscilla marina ATCC 23134 TaxID=313606 RepID=A1ZPZ1_MICM2|nr:TetR/AcrR family transcriptional regulator [Microscilla marina]EAY27646.1 transcriptional regulator, TetR family protein [Microscilla marina ATCC 23134]